MSIDLNDYFLERTNTKEATQRTLIRGPAAKLKRIAREKPKTDITTPNIEDRTMATRKLEALTNPIKAGVESRAITRMTPTAAIELTMTRAVVKPRAKFKEGTFMPLASAPSGSNPT